MDAAASSVGEGSVPTPPRRMRQTDFLEADAASRPVPTDEWLGRILDGHVLERKIDGGTHADVYQGRDRTLGGMSAVKVYHNGASGLIAAEEEAYQHRVSLRAQLRHESLIDVERLVQVDGRYCLITEYIDGVRLEKHIHDTGALPTSQAIALGEQIAQALSILHKQGVGYAHLTPRTILITKTGHIKVAGYGLNIPASIPDNDRPYTAPEAAAGNPCPESDVFSLSQILRDLLSGHCGHQDALPAACPPELSGLIIEMGSPDAGGRPPVPSILQTLQQLRCSMQKHETELLMANPNDVRRRLSLLLKKMEDFGASDLHIKAGSAPAYRIHGETRTANAAPMTVDQTRALVEEILDPEQIQSLKNQRSFDLSISLPHIGRFRANVFYQRGALSLTMRRVASKIPTPEDLLLPPALRKVSDYKDGLVLVTGATGSGKSTTLATLINLINESRHAHIVTIEDPLEYLHQDKMSFVTQREIGIDVPDFLSGIRDALRQAPDVILLGELRDEETVETAMAASETGHLVMSTLHAIDVTEAIRRILLFFPPDRQSSMRTMLGSVLRAIISQRMVPGLRPEYPRVVMMELLLMNEVIRQCINDNEDHRIIKQLETFTYEGMQSFNVSLLSLVRNRYVDPRIALQESPRPKDLERMMAT